MLTLCLWMFAAITFITEKTRIVKLKNIFNFVMIKQKLAKKGFNGN